MSWLENAERVSDGDARILGEDERGDLCVPSKTVPGQWDRLSDWRNPSHWRYYLRSRITRRVAFLERI